MDYFGAAGFRPSGVARTVTALVKSVEKKKQSASSVRYFDKNVV
jgi:hypothetical protein